MFISPSYHLPVCPSVYVCLTVHLSMFIWLSICLSFCPFTILSNCLLLCNFLELIHVNTIYLSFFLSRLPKCHHTSELLLIFLAPDKMDEFIHEPGQKSWGEGRGYGKFLGVEGSKNFRKFYCRFVIILRSPKNFLKKWHFLAKKVKNFFKSAIFFLKFCFAKF